MSAAGIGFLVGFLIGFALLIALLVGGILLVVSSRKSARLARQHTGDESAQGPQPGRGAGKLVGGIVMIVVGALGLLGQCANIANQASMQ